jgi:alpha-1,2-mannosyltransferase
VHNILYFLYFTTAIFAVATLFWLSRRPAWAALFNENLRAPEWQVAMLTGLCLLFALVGLRLSSPPDWFWDYTNAYYPAGNAMAHGDGAKLQALIGQGATGGFVNIPVVAYLFVPLGLLPPRISALIFTVTGLALTIAAWFMLVRLAKLARREQWILALLFLVNGPLLNGLKFGNLSYFVIAALAGGLLLVRSGRSGAAGLLLGLATVIKPPLLLFGLFFLLRRDVRGTLSFALSGAITAILSLVLFGWSDNWHWFQSCIVQYSQQWMGTFSVQSVSGFILRLDGTAKIADWTLSTPSFVESVLAKFMTASMFIIAAVAWFRRSAVVGEAVDPSHRLDKQYLLVTCLCLVSSPLAWSHYYAWLLVPTAFFLADNASNTLVPQARWVGWVAIALVMPLNGWPMEIHNPFLMTIYRSVFMSHMFIGGLLWFGLLAFNLSQSNGFWPNVSKKSLRTEVSAV